MKTAIYAALTRKPAWVETLVRTHLGYSSRTESKASGRELFAELGSSHYLALVLYLNTVEEADEPEGS